MRDLLDIHLDFAASLPADGAGGEGFDNAAETPFLTREREKLTIAGSGGAMTVRNNVPVRFKLRKLL